MIIQALSLLRECTKRITAKLNRRASNGVLLKLLSMVNKASLTLVAITAPYGLRLAALTSTFTNVLGGYGTLTARAPQRAHCEPPQRRARGVAFVIGIALSIPMQVADGGQIDAIRSDKDMIKSLASYQLTDEQYKCHNEIIYRESRWNFSAVGNLSGTKRVYGAYQIKSEYMKDAHPELQFWKYWQYVSHRYGITEYDEPMYCSALNHLKTKGWQ